MSLTASPDVIRAPDNVTVVNTVVIAEPITIDSITVSVTPGTGPTNLGKAEDAPHASGDVGVMALAVRNDAGVVLAGDGDYIALTTDSTGALRTTASLSSTIIANQGTPNTTINRWPVQLTDGVDLNTVTAAGEVNVLASAQPGVDVGDVTVNNGGGAAAVNIQDGGNSLTVDSVDLDIRNLVFATDKVDVSGSLVSVVEPVSVDDNGGSLTVDSVDLDIRNLVFATDKVDVSGSTVAISVVPATLAVTATAVIGVAATLTLPAAGVGLFHFITRLQITADTAPVALGANGSAVVTSTNLPGNPEWNMMITRNLGGIDREEMPRAAPLRSAVANTATTIVAPATANNVWRLNAEYFTA